VLEEVSEAGASVHLEARPDLVGGDDGGDADAGFRRDENLEPRLCVAIVVDEQPGAPLECRDLAKVAELRVPPRSGHALVSAVEHAATVNNKNAARTLRIWPV
jgi:hypothetical protein